MVRFAGLNATVAVHTETLEVEPYVFVHDHKSLLHSMAVSFKPSMTRTSPSLKDCGGSNGPGDFVTSVRRQKLMGAFKASRANLI